MLTAAYDAQLGYPDTRRTRRPWSAPGELNRQFSISRKDKTTKKIIKRVILGIVVLVILALAAVWLAINPIAKRAVQSGASDTLGVETTLETISISPLSGRLLMNKLNISNPEGFVSASLMNTGRFDIEVAPASLFSDTVEIRKFELDGLEMHIEQKLPLSNISRIMDNIKKSSADKEETASDGKKVKADLILIKNVEAYFHLLPGTSKAGVVKVEVPQLELKNVSSDNKPGFPR